MQQPFVHLRLHTEYSLVDGLVRIDDLMQALPARDMKAVAVTDYCNLFAVVKHYQAATAKGLKPIIGCELPYVDPTYPDKLFSMVLLCCNQQGYRNLTCLVSRAYQEGQQQGRPQVEAAWIAMHSEGLIALSGGMRGDIGQALLAKNLKLAQQRADYWQKLFPKRFYLEIQRVGREGETAYNAQLLQLADQLQLPLVATNDVRFLDASDFDAHEARVCIHEGYTLADPRRKKEHSPQQYLRSPKEMQTLFADLPSALANTVEISKRCTVSLNLGNNYLPNFPTPANSTVEVYLSQLSEQGLAVRLDHITCDSTAEEKNHLRAIYSSRLEDELQVINRMGFASYFLIVADFIRWAKENGIPVGPGRGSGAGSLVAYVLQITDLDPIPYDLLFERFLNPERVSMPDFDIDFCMEGRDRVIDYVAEKYGRQAVSQIITFGTMAAKAVVRDVGRVLGLPYPFVDQLAKLIPFELGMTLTKALEQEAELAERYKNDEEVKELIDLALKLEGLTKNAGKHAGGVVIAPSQLTDYTAIYCEQGSTQIVSQLDKDDVEAAGLVKFDFLGLRTLTIIDWALQSINAQRQTPLDITRIPLDDPKSFALLSACKTTAVFQLESRGMKEIIHRLQPDSFEDIIALVALFRPGPLQSGMVDDFIDRKHGRATVHYPHPDLEPILKPTYGVILYQEQVMQIAQVLANYTLGAADLLRRAMGKKKPEEMAKQREIFTEGAVARQVDAATATHIFDLMEKFAGYGFNKSHSAAYALVSYQTAWLKAHYPAAFMAAVLSSDMDNTDKIVTFIKECADMQLQVRPPCINHSQYHFTVLDDATIIYGLGAVKGVGQAAIECITKEREQGPYKDLFDFCKRLDLRKINRRALEPLIKSGCFDSWQVERAVLQASVDKAIKIAEASHKNQALGQLDLFATLADETANQSYVPSNSWSTLTRLQAEKEVLGFYLSGHPADAYARELNTIITPIGQLNPSLRKKSLICGQVTGIRKIITKRGKILFIVGLEDATGRLDIMVFSEVFEACPLVSSAMAVIEGEIAVDEYNGGVKMTAQQLYSIERARITWARCLELSLSPQDKEKLAPLQALLSTHPGPCPVQLAYSNQEAKVMLTAGRLWQVTPNEELLAALKSLLGETQVGMRY